MLEESIHYCLEQQRFLENWKQQKFPLQLKLISLFYKSKLYKDGYSYCCKECDKNIHKPYYKCNKDRIIKKNKLWRQKNKEKYNKIQENYKEKRNYLLKKRYHNDENYRNNCLKSYHKYRNNPINKDAIKLTQKKNKLKYRSDPQYRIVDNLRCRLRQSLKVTKNKKYNKTMMLLGCDRLTLVSYLESKFKPGMNWENHTTKGWHVDHIKPCSSFDFNDLDQMKQCFHYTNLQPLWWRENLKKGDTYDEEEFKEYIERKQAEEDKKKEKV